MGRIDRRLKMPVLQGLSIKYAQILIILLEILRPLTFMSHTPARRPRRAASSIMREKALVLVGLRTCSRTDKHRLSYETGVA
jgi:hypothetical protein